MFNVYYKSDKINKIPIDESVVSEIQRKPYVYTKKRDRSTNEIKTTKIPSNKLKFVKTYIMK